MIYGYARVSSKDQNEDRQMIALRKFGCDRILLDKQSGKDFERASWKRIILKLRKGDVLVVESIDRLGRNYADIREQWRIVTKVKQADIVVLDMPLLDTRPGKDLTGSLIADIVLSLLSYVAQVERENIRKRQAEGIAAAKARGVRFGREPIKIPSGFQLTKFSYLAGNLTIDEAAARLGVSTSTFRRWCAKETTKEENNADKNWKRAY